MKKNYIIRKIAYAYDDQSFFSTGLGCIVGNIYPDYEAAYQHLLEAERVEYLEHRTYIDDFYPFTPLCFYEPTEKMVQLKAFFETAMGITAFEVLENGLLQVQPDWCLPENVTIEQVHQIRTLSDLKFYEIIAFDNPEPPFYGIWLRKPFAESTGFKMVHEQEPSSIIFYSTYEEALSAASHELSEIRNIVLKKPLEMLSEMPIVLKSMIDNSKNIDYDESKKCLTIHRVNAKEWLTLCSLLKKKPFEIRTIPFELAKSAAHWVFELPS